MEGAKIRSPSPCASCDILTKREIFSLFSLLEWQRCEGGEPKVRQCNMKKAVSNCLKWSVISLDSHELPVPETRGEGAVSSRLLQRRARHQKEGRL